VGGPGLAFETWVFPPVWICGTRDRLEGKVRGAPGDGCGDEPKNFARSECRGCLPSTATPVHRATILCHLDRSAAQWRDLRFSGPFLEMFRQSGASRLDGMIRLFFEGRR
jgi:hypothetical protein